MSSSAAPHSDTPLPSQGEARRPEQRPLPSWVPIRSLSPRHRDRILAHLLQLEPQDRYLRFGYAASDEQVAAYVASLDFKRDEVFGVFNRRLELIGMAHLAYEPPPQREGQKAMAEFGVSVTHKGRGRGLGQRLFEHAMLHARNRGIQTLFIHALTQNAPMLRLARKAGATVERDGSESMAWLQLPPDTIASHVDELVDEHAAEIDYQVKFQARWMDRLWSRLSAPFGARRGGDTPLS